MNTHGLIAGLAVASVWVQDGTEAQAQTPPQQPPLQAAVEPEFLLLDLLYDGIRVDTSFAALTDSRGRRFLALKPMSMALGCRLQINAAKKTVSGFLASPSDRVEFNGVAGICKRGVTKIKFEAWQCFEKEGDLYLEEGLLAKWAGFHLLWRMNRLELEVTADRSLPVRRQLTQLRLLDQQSVSAKKTQPQVFVQNPYELFTPPSIDAQLYTTTAGGPNAAESDSRIVIQGVGDAFYMGAKYRYYSRTKQDRAAMLLTLSREDASGKLLGPLRAKQVSFGDVTIPSLALLDRARSGLGISISNFPLSGSDGSPDSALEGKSAPNSVVELYRENDLIRTVRADREGKFIFDNLQLETGPNILRVVATSPDGEVQEDRRILYGDASGPKPGKSRYRLTAAQVGGSLLNAPLEEAGDTLRKKEIVVEYQRGLTTATWLSAMLAQSNRGSDLGLGIHTWTGDTLLRAQATASQNGDASASLGVSRKFGNSTVSLENTRSLSKKQLEVAPELGSDASSITKLRLDGVFGARQRQISWGLGIDRLEGTNSSTLIRGRMSGSSYGYFLSNSVALRYSSSPFEGSGLFQVRRQFAGTTGRFDVRYGIGSGSLFESMHLSADRRLSSAYRARLGLDYDSSRIANFDMVGSIYRMFGPLALGVSASVDSAGGMKANLLLSVGFAGDTLFEKAAMSKSGTSQSGCVQVRAFLDRNLSGKFDEGDQLLPNIGVRLNGHLSRAKTGSGGVCVVDRLAPSQSVAIALNEDTFIDPIWVTSSPSVNVVPRAGRTVKLDFAVVESAEIEGKAVGFEGRAPGLVAQLIKADDSIAQSSVLDTDGYYVFSLIQPGDYRLRIVDAEGSKLCERSIKVGIGSLLKGIDMTILPRSR